MFPHVRAGRLLAGVTASAVLLVVAARPAEADTAESIAAYTVGLSVQADGRLHVRETIAYDFGANQRHGILREIPATARYDDKYDRLYRIENVAVTSPDGAPTDVQVSGVSYVTIRIGDPNRTISGRHTYVIDYDVVGALSPFAKHVELYWNAVGDQWQVPIAGVTATVTTPVEITRVACFSGFRGSTLPCASARTTGSTATFTQPSLAARQGLTVVVALPAGSVPAKPILRERYVFRAFALTPAAAGGLGLIFLLTVSAAGWLLWIRGRDRRYAGQVPGLTPVAGQDDAQEYGPLVTRSDGAVEFAPPDGIRPGQVGTLIDERANVLDVTATIVDLAVRNYVFIEEVPQSSWFSGRDWRLSRRDDPGASLLPYERTLYTALFYGRDAVYLSQLRYTFKPIMNAVRGQLYDDVVAQAWFTRRPDAVRSRWTALGLALAAASVPLLMFLVVLNRLALLAVGLFFAGVALAICGRFAPARTARGSAVLARVLGFRRYLETAEADQLRFDERESIFSRYLPYAIVFGLTERWARAFASLGAGRQPGTGLYWYSGPGAWDLSHFGDSIGSFAIMSTGVLSSSPPLVSAGSGGGGSSSGFSGGSSGGGGGGGGGSSW